MRNKRGAHTQNTCATTVLPLAVQLLPRASEIPLDLLAPLALRMEQLLGPLALFPHDLLTDGLLAKHNKRSRWKRVLHAAKLDRYCKNNGHCSVLATSPIADRAEREDWASLGSWPIANLTPCCDRAIFVRIRCATYTC